MTLPDDYLHEFVDTAKDLFGGTSWERIQPCLKSSWVDPGGAGWTAVEPRIRAMWTGGTRASCGDGGSGGAVRTIGALPAPDTLGMRFIARREAQKTNGTP